MVWISFLGQASAQSRPNVLLIMTDDQGYGDIGRSGNDKIRTPNLDRMARESVSFNHFYVSPVCAPTRASLLTGRYAQRTGVRSVTNGFETIQPEEVTLAEMLSPAGYRTGIFGKWHLGENYPSVPNAQGFDEFIGFRTGHFDDYFDPILERNGQPYPTKGYITDVLTDEAIRFMEESKGQPFLCYLPYNAPHTPLYVPDAYLQKYQDQGLPERVARVYAMVENIDDNIGRLLDRLKATGLDKKTIVVFLSDNGPIDGFRSRPETWRFNAGLRDQKFSMYEGGIRTQFFMRWPKQVTAGKQVDQIAAHIDVVPTLLDMCGVAVPPSVQLDGRSLRPLLKGKTKKWPDRTLFLQYALETLTTPAPYPGGIARTQRYKMVDGEELYDLINDPGETQNLTQEKPTVLAQLDHAYRQWWQEVVPEGGFSLQPIPVGYPQAEEVTLTPHLGRVQGGLKYLGFRGLFGKSTVGAHPSGVDGDWISNWKSADDLISWQVEVVEPGQYRISLPIRSKAGEAGSLVRVSVGDKQVERSVPTADLNLGHWETVPWGTLLLEPGKYQLSVQALQVAGESVMELGGVVFEKIK